MLLEQRINWLNLENISTDVDIISIGNEGCIIPFLHIEKCWDNFLKLTELPKRVKVVLPRIAQDNLTITINLMKKIWSLQRNVEVVLNDWGIVFFCVQHLCDIKIHIGRQLCRSLLDCPWKNEIINNETNSVQRIISSHPYNDISRLNRLKHIGIYGIEFNAIPYFDESNAFKMAQIETSIDGKTYLLTCGKNCLTKRIIDNRDCLEICDSHLDILPMGKWLGYFDNDKAYSEYEAGLLKGLRVKGKSVLLPQNDGMNKIISSGINAIIVHDTSTIKEIRSITQ